MLYYAGGKEVSRGEAAYSETISVHSKCIEWYGFAASTFYFDKSFDTGFPIYAGGAIHA